MAIKIGIFVDEFPPFLRGGLGTYAMEISKKFVERGNEVTIFTRNPNSPNKTFEEDEWYGAKVVRAPNVKPDCFPAFLPPHVRTWGRDGENFYAETLFYNIFSIEKAVKIAEKGLDLVVSHDWLAAPAGVITSKNLKIPFVLHFHSSEPGRIANPSPDVCEIEKCSGYKADKIVTVSYAMKDELKRYYGFDAEVAYNGVDADKYNPKLYKDEIDEFKSKLGLDEPIVLFLGRLTWVKGVDSLIKAMPEIEENCKEKPKLVIVGKGEMECYVRELIRKLDVNALTRFEFVSEKERILHYLSADVVVLPSRYEPFGIVCTEAMALERAVVVGAKGTSGMREQVVTGETGFHIDPDNPHDIAEYTSIVLNDEKLRVKMGKAGRKRVLEMFTWDICAERTLEIYSSVVNSVS